jgi:hypothetical protein
MITRCTLNYIIPIVLWMAQLSHLCAAEATLPQAMVGTVDSRGFTDAAAFGFSPEASGVDNTKALQRAVDLGGTIEVSRPGTYKIAGTVFVGNDTSLIFGNGVFLKKVSEQGPFMNVLLNRGALNKTWNHHITVEGLQIIVNGVDNLSNCHVFGLRGQLAFFYVKDLRIEHFRCLDLGRGQFAIHICTFEDLLINDVIIKGQKDGLHLGPGKRFTISNGTFQTGDDAVALNAHDYASSNPELGWIEDGVVENCHDLAGENNTGYFCRILAGAWIDWKPGMELQNSDTVVSDGRLYRVKAQADGQLYKSLTPPQFEAGSQVLDGITWVMVQTNVTYTVGVRNVTFRDIFLEKPRIAFSIHFDNDRYSRSYYPGATVPLQENILFDDIRVLYDAPTPVLSITTPVDAITILHSSFRNNRISFASNKAMPDYGRTMLNLIGCIFKHPGTMELLANSVTNKVITLKTTASVEVSKDFSAKVTPGGGKIIVDSDLTGLKRAVVVH